MSCQCIHNGAFVKEHDSCRVMHHSDDAFQMYVCLQYTCTPMRRLFRLSRPNGSFLIRNPSYPCGWAVRSSVWGSCQPMSVWPGRLGRLVHDLIKTFSVCSATVFLHRVLFLLHPDTISHLLHVVLEINTQMRVAFVWRHAWKDPS